MKETKEAKKEEGRRIIVKITGYGVANSVKRFKDKAEFEKYLKLHKSSILGYDILPESKAKAIERALLKMPKVETGNGVVKVEKVD